MTAPRHLWSGDWQRESAAAAEERAGRRAAAEELPPASSPSPPSPAAPSVAARALARIRTLPSVAARALARIRTAPSVAARALARIRTLPAGGAILMALAMLLSAGAAYAAVSSLVSSGSGGSARGVHQPVTSSPAKTAAPAWLGVQTMSFGPADGVMVVDVVPGSPADAAGLQPGDLITQIGNRPVQAPADLESALAGMHPGQRVEIQYQQALSAYTAQVTLRARPANGP